MSSAVRSARFTACLLIALLGRTAPAQTFEPDSVTVRTADPYADARRLLREEKFAEGADAFAKLAAANPYDGWIWGNWGYCLHALKRYDEAIPLFLKAVELDSSPASYLYNISCAHALMGHKDEALTWLGKALDARFVTQTTLENDTDLDSIRDDPRFAALTGITYRLKAPLVHSRDEGWRWDLAFYARRMKQMHWDLYNKVSESAFHAELDRLAREVGGIDDDQARARLRKITAMVGDGHTAVSLPAEGATTVRRLPLHFYSFKDGLYIIGASGDVTSLLGAKVLKVGSLDSEAALAAVRPFLSVDNEMGYRSGAPEFLSIPIILREIGAAADDTGADITVVPVGSQRTTIHVKSAEIPRASHGGAFRSDLAYVHQSSKEPLPLYLRDTTRNLRMEYDPEHRLVYFWFGGIADDPDVSIADFSQHLFEFIEKNNVEHLVIDMRFNGGGNTGLIRPLLNGLGAAKTIDRTGHLWVIIGRRTFSAAQNTVNLMNSFDHPIFVGEPTGSRPRFIGESTSFVLPHSKTRVYCSSRYWQVLDSTDDRCWIPPQIVAEPTYADYAAGRDPAMDAIYAALAPGSGSSEKSSGGQR